MQVEPFTTSSPDAANKSMRGPTAVYAVHGKSRKRATHCKELKWISQFLKSVDLQ